MIARPCKEAALAEHSKNGRRLQQKSVMGIGGRSVQSATAGGTANRQARFCADDGSGMCVHTGSRLCQTAKSASAYGVRTEEESKCVLYCSIAENRLYAQALLRMSRAYDDVRFISSRVRRGVVARNKEQHDGQATFLLS